MLVGTARHYLGVRRVFRSYGTCFPDKRLRLIFFLVFESLSRRSRLRLSSIPISRALSRQLGDFFQRLYGLLVLLGHDDDFDGRGSSAEEMYSYLERALCGYLAGLRGGLPIEGETLLRGFDEFDEVFKRSFAESPLFNALSRDRCQLRRSAFVARLRRLRRVGRDDLLFSSQDGGSADTRNVPIVAAIEFGRTLRLLQALLRRHGVPEATLEWQSTLIATCFIKCGYAQAHSAEQRDIDSFDWQRYCRLAIWKSNAIEDIGAAVRGVLNRTHFSARRFSPVRFCEQIYLDDLQDLREDSEDRILGAAHAFCLAQGRLAAEAVRLGVATGREDTSARHGLWHALENSGVLERRLEGTFLQQNAEAAGPRCRRTSRWSGDPTGALREALANTKIEISLPLDLLIVRRCQDAARLRQAWDRADGAAIERVLHRSGVPLRFVRGFVAYLAEVRADFLVAGEGSTLRPGYYLFLQGLTHLMLSGLWLGRWRTLVAQWWQSFCRWRALRPLHSSPQATDPDEQ